MQNFVFENPTRIIFGRDTIGRIGAEAKRFGTKVLLVYGQGSIKNNGVYDQVIASFEDAALPVVEFPGVKSNPVLSHALQGIELARRDGIDVIVAVGGGSVIDTAKTIAVGAVADPGDDIWDFFTYKKKITGALPLLTVLTISASASEMNPGAVITKEEGAQKYSIRSPHIQPKTSIMDPTVLFSLSPAYSAYSAVDAVTHMLEGYFNNTEPESILQDRLVEGLMKTIMESTGRILENPHDYDARANMMWATTLAFNGITTAGMGMIALPAHMIEHSLSALYDIPHGAGLSIVLPGWMAYALPQIPARFGRLAREIFNVDNGDDIHAGAEGIRLLKQWFSSIGSPVSLSEAGIPAADIDRIAENAFVLSRVWGLNAYTKEIIADILRICNGG
jgi:hypothetical protein